MGGGGSKGLGNLQIIFVPFLIDFLIPRNFLPWQCSVLVFGVIIHTTLGIFFWEIRLLVNILTFYTWESTYLNIAGIKSSLHCIFKQILLRLKQCPVKCFTVKENFTALPGIFYVFSKQYKNKASQVYKIPYAYIFSLVTRRTIMIISMFWKTLQSLNRPFLSGNVWWPSISHFPQEQGMLIWLFEAYEGQIEVPCF